MSATPLATRVPLRLVADRARVIVQLFVPDHYLPEGREGRASGVVEHMLSLSDEDVTATLREIMGRFDGRHHDLADAFRRHADRIGDRFEPGVELSDERCLLLGATFTQEYSVEAAALCNPSAVALPDQSGVDPGALRFVMSVRQIGEGHRSSIGFRTGTIDGYGGVVVDDPGPFATAGAVNSSQLDADTFRGLAHGSHEDAEAMRWVLDRLGDHFTVAELDGRLVQLEAQRDTRRNVAETARRVRELAARAYTSHFPPSSALAERVLTASTRAESNGVEDARFVRFVDDDGAATYLATYTAFDGAAIAQQLLSTTDFVTFASSPLTGAGAVNKGMALFPRRVGGRFAALSRCDGVSNAIAFSDDLHRWPAAIALDCPTETWEVIKVGNCGSPIETDEGWLVLTHGVGPMRTYSIGAWLLDLEDPTRVIGRLRRPLLAPMADEQDGYVPNVVYSCGALLHAGTLLVPFGIGDAAVGFATVGLGQLLEAMVHDLEDAPVPS